MNKSNKTTIYYQANKEQILAKRKIMRKKPLTKAQRIARIKRSATKRGLPWNLSNDFIENLQSTCFYSGVPLSFQPHNKDVLSFDRIDSSIKSYEDTNTVPCSWIVNRMKTNHSVEEFLDLCESVVKYQHQLRDRAC
jgi:hypothetical protein